MAIIESSIRHRYSRSRASASDRERSRSWLICFAAAISVLLLLPFVGHTETTPDLVLRGTVEGKDNHTYRLISFTVPPGTARITLEVNYSGKEQHTVLDWGLFDPSGFRGWSGGNKSLFTVSASDATPSYLPGEIVPGLWKLLIAVPNIRPDTTSEFTANVYFSRSGVVAAEPGILPAVLKSAAGWYRGDLHSHTAHSDGSCESQSGKKVPCPLFLTAQTAARRGLDFLAITDHNTTSHFSEVRELQPFFDKLLLIPGREITTFQGHANLFGTTDFVDFRVTSDSVPAWNDLLRRLPSDGVVLSVNHPSRPTGEVCMGCGWHPDPEVDWRLIHVMEAVNSYDSATSSSGIGFWQSKLNEGFRITGIGGGDNHNALASIPGSGSVGYPTTVVWANTLSMRAILEGILTGHAFIDVTGSTNRVLEFTASSSARRAAMGDTLRLAASTPAMFQVRVQAAAGGNIEVIEDGGTIRPLQDPNVTQPDQSFSFHWTSDPGRHWFRINVRDNDGKLWLVGNPIYINFD